MYNRIARFEGAFAEKVCTPLDRQKLVTACAHVILREHVVGVVDHFLAAAWTCGKSFLHSFPSIAYLRFHRHGPFARFCSCARKYEKPSIQLLNGEWEH
jgi:hypothetical protein